jgi:hypothetical protein
MTLKQRWHKIAASGWFGFSAAGMIVLYAIALLPLGFGFVPVTSENMIPPLAGLFSAVLMLLGHLAYRFGADVENMNNKPATISELANAVSRELEAAKSPSERKEILDILTDGYCVKCGDRIPLHVGCQCDNDE